MEAIWRYLFRQNTRQPAGVVTRPEAHSSSRGDQSMASWSLVESTTLSSRCIQNPWGKHALPQRSWTPGGKRTFPTLLLPICLLCRGMKNGRMIINHELFCPTYWLTWRMKMFNLPSIRLRSAVRQTVSFSAGVGWALWWTAPQREGVAGESPTHWAAASCVVFV